MKNELVLLLFGILVLVFVVRHSRSKKNCQSQKASYRGDYHRNNVGKKFQPFDAKRARLQPSNTVLKGLAYVFDGDTMVIQKTQIRLFGVDAPEINHPYGQKAKWALVSLCKGQTVHAETIEQDDHGRVVARCYLQDGRDLSAEMVNLGLAIDWPKFSGGKYQALEVPELRKKLWLVDARQKGRVHVLRQFEAKQRIRTAKG